jgi:hypothetical protein
MTTITKTTAAAVSRKLNSMNFERFDGNIGYEVLEAKSYEPITIIHRVYGDYGFQMALELEAAGYAVTCDKVQSWRNPEISVQLIQVLGKITA